MMQKLLVGHMICIEELSVKKQGVYWMKEIIVVLHTITKRDLRISITQNHMLLQAIKFNSFDYICVLFDKL